VVVVAELGLAVTMRQTVMAAMVVMDLPIVLQAHLLLMQAAVVVEPLTQLVQVVQAAAVLVVLLLVQQLLELLIEAAVAEQVETMALALQVVQA
jgi:hypothetical protein